MRYRVLYDLDVPGDARPCGVIVDRGQAGVEIVAPGDKCFPSMVAEPFPRLRYQDMTTETILPGHAEYFDEVAASVHRHFALGDEFDSHSKSETPSGSTERKKG